jgi:hypothetical protein
MIALVMLLLGTPLFCSFLFLEKVESSFLLWPVQQLFSLGFSWQQYRRSSLAFFIISKFLSRSDPGFASASRICSKLRFFSLSLFLFLIFFF